MQHKLISFHFPHNDFPLQCVNNKKMATRPNLASFLSSSNNSKQSSASRDAGVVRKGYLGKRKSMGIKNRYFVLRSESNEDSAILEKYENDKKFTDGYQPSKKYVLKHCTNIIRKTDKNNSCVIALYINKECVALVAENEVVLQEWLKDLQIHKNRHIHSLNPKMEYEHVWQVEVISRSFADAHNLTGQHFLYLTNWLLSLVRVDDPTKKKDFLLSTIKKCGNFDQFFLIVLGRYSCIGSGDLRLKTEDSFIAQNIYQSVLSAMNSYNYRLVTESNAMPVRPRTISDPQADFPINERRGRADSVPNSRKPQSMRRLQCPSLEIIHQQQPKLDLSDPKLFASWFEENLQSPDRDLEEDLSEYIQCESLVDVQNSSSTLSSPRMPIAEFPESPEGNIGYLNMNQGTARERQAPNSLGISPRNITHPELVSGSCDPHGISSPVSPSIGGMPFWRSGSIGATTPSPQSVSAPHSRNPSLLDEAYVNMGSPGSQGPQGGATSSYLKMGPRPTLGNHERQRTISTPTPIPSPSDEDSSCDAYNSGSSSCTSGTPSDQRIHDIGGEERGDTPPSSMWNNLSPHYMPMDDPDCIGGPRSLRTNSVGSKPEQFKRKNRLDGTVPVGEPARVRAFSVGSRVSFRFGVGCHGTGVAHQGTEHQTGGLGDIFPSIKECGKQAKSKSSSAPMLGASPISHSWSGTPGTYFPGCMQNRNMLRATNLMELDFSKNKSCDFIPVEEKEKEKERRTSKERLIHTFTGHRNRSNSKSSGNSTSVKGSESWGVGRDKRVSESDATSRGLDIPYFAGDRSDYLQLDFTRSPRGSSSDPNRGYLVMHPPSFLSSSLTTTAELAMEKRGHRTSSFNEACLAMSSSLSSCASDVYVDMTKGGSSSALTIASSSSSSNSINTPPISGWPLRLSSNAPVVSSQELPSPVECLVKDEEVDFCLEGRKKSKKGRRKSFRDGSKKKKSDPGFGSESSDATFKNRSHGPLATLTNLITRKPNNNSPKVPLSPRGSPLPPKGGKESTSPFSSLTRSKSKGKDLFSDIGEERETVSLSGDLMSSTPPSFSPQSSLRRRTLGGLELSSPPVFPVLQEEKMLLSPQEGKLLLQASYTEEKKRNSAYVNMEEAASSSSSLPSLNLIQKGFIKPLHLAESRNYVNMHPGSSSPQLSPPATDISSPKPIVNTNISSTVASKPQPEDNYMLMGGGENTKQSNVSPFQNYMMMGSEERMGGGDNTKQSNVSPFQNYMMMGSEESTKEPHVPSFPSAVAKRPEIPPTLLSSHPHSPSLTFEKLSLKEEKHGGHCSERSRSHSGPGAPGAPESAKGTKKTEDGRAASACSSPVSYSPPTSPTLGSVSSMSSLSEGGLSSASSTCTVVNVGVKNLCGNNPTLNLKAASSATSTTSTTTTTTSHPVAAPPSEPSNPTVDIQPCSSSSNKSTQDGLNYASLDLGNKTNNNKNDKGSNSPRLANKNVVVPTSSSADDAPLSYVEIDFKKSEGLRNTSLARDSSTSLLARDSSTSLARDVKRPH